MYQKEAAKRLGVAVATLRNWERNGLVIGYQGYRGKHRRNYTEAEVEQIRWNLVAKRPGKANFPKRIKPAGSNEPDVTKP